MQPYEDEAGGMDLPYGELPLGEERRVRLSSEDCAWAAAWSWVYDEASGEAVRFDRRGRKIFLYHELLRRHQGSDELLVMHPDSVERVFGGFASYRAFVEQWEERAAMVDVALPAAGYFAGCALSVALGLYYAWQAEGRSIRYQGDPERLTPGWLTNCPPKRYRRLGTWFTQEYTGDWLPDEDAPCGLVPEPYDIRLLQGFILLLYSLLGREGMKEEDVQDMWEQFEQHGMGFADPFLALLHTLEHYPAPGPAPRA